jgi:hypothetical protein
MLLSNFRETHSPQWFIGGSPVDEIVRRCNPHWKLQNLPGIELGLNYTNIGVSRISRCLLSNSFNNQQADKGKDVVDSCFPVNGSPSQGYQWVVSKMKAGEVM